MTSQNCRKASRNCLFLSLQITTSLSEYLLSAYPGEEVGEGYDLPQGSCTPVEGVSYLLFFFF